MRRLCCELVTATLTNGATGTGKQYNLRSTPGQVDWGPNVSRLGGGPMNRDLKQRASASVCFLDVRASFDPSGRLKSRRLAEDCVCRNPICTAMQATTLDILGCINAMPQSRSG